MSQPAEHRGGSILYVSLLTVVAALGGLLFGYDTGVINGAIGFLQARFQLDPTWEGFAAACALAGCVVGAGSAGFLSDRLGRKRVLILAAVTFLVSSLGTALPRNLTEFILFRFLAGAAIGAASITSPMYIAEVTPFRIRGRMVSINQLAIVSGMAAVFFVNYYIAEYGAGRDRETVAALQREQGPELDRVFVRGYLHERLAAKLAGDALAAYDREHPGQSEDSPGRRGVRDSASQAAADEIDAFLVVAALGTTRLDSRAVAEFLKAHEIRVDPVAVDLARFQVPSWNVERGWRWMFGSGALPALVFLALLFLVPESPRWLTKQDRPGEALAILTRVDGPAYARDELAMIQETISQETGRLAELVAPGLRRVLAIGVALAVLQQITGINVFLYFGTEIFKSLGSEASTAMLQNVIVGAVNAAFTLVAIGVVDRLGRKPLMLVGAAGMGVSLVSLGLAAYTQSVGRWVLGFMLSYTACFALSVGPVTWVILSEIFPTRVRGRAMGIATICLWSANFVVSQTFPMMDKNARLIRLFHHGFPFWVYAAFCAVLVLVVWRWVPETKGKSLEEIERSWTGGM